MGNFQYSPPKNQPVPTTQLIADLRSVAKKLGTEKLSQSQYLKSGKFSPTTFYYRFGTWNKALEEAGLRPYRIISYSDEQLFENILNVWQKKGAQPTRRDMNSSFSEISVTPYIKRFKTWSDTLKEFIQYANSKETPLRKEAVNQHPTKNAKRDPSLRLRYKVLKRDDFSCVQCGMSPAKDRNVILHVDHIKPWSRGGNTDLSNLQTLCQKCNLGKSNLE